MKSLRAIIIVILMVGFALPGWSGEYTIFGPKQFVRGTGGPVKETVNFSSPVVGSGFTMKIQNGDTQGGNRVSSATITLYGTQIFGPPDFNQQTGSLQHIVSLGSSNSLSVNLASAPASVLTIAVTGEDDTPPVIVITTPQNGSATGAGSINVSGKVSDDTPVTFVVNGIMATVSGGTFTATGIPLTAGQNTITATATDLGGNSTSTAITVIREIDPPNVVGMDQSSAVAAIIAGQLSVGNVTLSYSDTVTADEVISQIPAASVLVMPGTAVDLVVSKGPAPVPVPSVIGMTQASAAAAIVAARLSVGTLTSAYSDTVPAGDITSQSPAASQLLLPGTAVDLVISKGPATVSVPNVVGMTQANAEAAITAMNLQVGGTTATYSSTVPAGNVMSQKPTAKAVVNQGTSIVLVISNGPAPVVIPPDPATVAPPVDGTVATTVAGSTAFLYSGDNPIQTGVAAGTIEVKRAAVLRGQVNDRDGNPLSGVTVTILSHPEFGQTLARIDGMFDMAVNGGGLLTVTYQKTGYLPAQRQVNAPWQDFAWLPAVALIPVDAQVTTINLASTSQIQVHQGTVVTDTDGTRQATLMFSPGTTAQLVMPDGSMQSVGNLNIRATEYTVGSNGPKAMPGQLPPASGCAGCSPLRPAQAEP